MKIALTGGSGRIGRAIATDALRQGHQVVSIDRIPPDGSVKGDGLVFVRADIVNYDQLLRAFEGCDAVIHMGAIPSPGRHPDHVVHNNNVTGSYNALRAAVEVGIKRICQASSVNAIGLSYSRESHFEYLPIDEKHPNASEDPYSLSKWICEQQADSFARRHEDLTIASMRFHLVIPERADAVKVYGVASSERAKHLWAYTTLAAASSACLLSLTAPYKGHEVFYITAPDTVLDVPSADLARQFFPNVPIRGDLSGRRSLINSQKAERLLGWRHDAP